jgi:hypothetical protein
MDQQSTPNVYPSGNKRILATAIVAFAFILLILFVSILATRNTSQNTNNDTSTQTELTQNLSVVIKVSESDSKEYSLNYTQNENVLEMLGRLDNSDQDFSFNYEIFEGIGAFVNELNGIKADGITEFWGFMINDQFAQVGPEGYVLNPGDTISFELTLVEGN